MEIVRGAAAQARAVRSTSAQVELVAPLFDAYRQFYGLLSDLAGAHRFLAERLERQESVIFLAVLDRAGRAEGEEVAAGFTQLYPSFSSERMGRIWILNDLFVRAGGVRLQLLA